MSMRQDDGKDRVADKGSGTVDAGAAIRIVVELDRRTAEVLRLELRRLASGYGVDPNLIHFETAPRRARPVL
ncbi:MAG TPA: hypothetical protein VFC42_03340 [Methylomirabilota bacterium]|jgi:hypothetical protein|nr:hypothetical protein [Methylomirabilota bacterium]